MTRYIDADLVEKLLGKAYDDCMTAALIPENKVQNHIATGINYSRNIISDYIPTADVKEVVHGEWILNCINQKLLDDYGEEYYVECSECHRAEFVPFEFEEEKMLEYAKKHFPFCHCGADMRGDVNNGK